MTTQQKVLLALFVVLNISVAAICALPVLVYSSFYYFEMHIPTDAGVVNQVQLTFAQVLYKVGITVGWSGVFAAVIAYCSFLLLDAVWGSSLGRAFKLTLALIAWLIVISGSIAPSFEFFSQRAPFF